MRWLIILGSLALFMSCNKSYNEHKALKIVEDIIVSEEASGIKNDTLLLEYRFGMSLKEFTAHTANLALSKKIEWNQNNELVYLISTSKYSQPIPSIIKARFKSDTLYALELTLKDSYYNAESTISDLYYLYKIKYGLPANYNIKYYPKNSHVWVDGNRQIKIYAVENRPTILYIDSYQEQMIEELQSIHSQEKSDKQSLEFKRTTTEI